MRKEVLRVELELVIKGLTRAKIDLQTKLDKLIVSREKAKKTMVVKGYDVSSESDLDELIAGDVINATQYDTYLERLRKLQKEVKFDDEQEALESAIEYFNREIANAQMNLED